MAEEKSSGSVGNDANAGGGDLFEGLGKKSSRQPSGAPKSVAAPPPPPSMAVPAPPQPQLASKQTLLGIPSPLNGGSAPPPAPPSKANLPAISAPPPPSRTLTAPLTPPPPPPAPMTTKAGGAGAGLEMDWDDDNEATHVFDKDAAGANGLLGPMTTPHTLRGTGAPPPPAANDSMRAAVKASAPIGAGPSVSQAVGAISASQSARLVGETPPPPPSITHSKGSVPPPPSKLSPSAPPPPPASAKPPSTVPPAPVHAPLASTLASHNAPPPSAAAAPSDKVQIAPAAESQVPTGRPRSMEATAVIPPAAPPAKNNSTGLMIGVVAAIALIGGGLYFMGQREGTLVVSAVNEQGVNLDHVGVYVDGTRTACETSPCTLELSPGKHTIKAISNGLSTPDAKEVAIESGKSASVPFQFAGSGMGVSAPNGAAQTAQATTTGSLKIASAATGLSVFVDGVERGALPADLSDLSPGSHTIKLAGNDRYAPFERTVNVSAGGTTDLGTITPKVVRGRATIELQTEGAKLSIQAPGEPTRAINPPVPPLDVDTSKGWTVRATKAGFEDAVVPLVFAEGEPAEKSFVISLSPKAATAAPTATTKTPIHNGSASTSNSSSSSSSSTPSGTGTLTINSMPASRVVVDGRPVGETPVNNYSVSAGKHKVLLINTDQDLRKTVNVEVKPGQNQKVIVNLKN